jgi:hypothetical protein
MFIDNAITLSTYHADMTIMVKLTSRVQAVETNKINFYNSAKNQD